MRNVYVVKGEKIKITLSGGICNMCARHEDVTKSIQKKGDKMQNYEMALQLASMESDFLKYCWLLSLQWVLPSRGDPLITGYLPPPSYCMRIYSYIMIHHHHHHHHHVSALV